MIFSWIGGLTSLMSYYLNFLLSIGIGEVIIFVFICLVLIAFFKRVV